MSSITCPVLIHFFCFSLSEKLHQLGAVDLDAGAHGGGHGAGTDILALGSGGLGLDDGADQSVEVIVQLLGAKGNLADGAVNDVGLVETVLDLTGLSLETALAASGVTVPALG